MGLLTELKRRNVFRVAIAYGVIAWVLAQVADLAFDNFGTPEWVGKTVLFLLVLGFPLAVFFAWAFEMTPEGVKKEKDVDRSESITHQTGRKLDYLIIGMLVVAVGWLLADKFILQEGSSVGVEQTYVDAVTNKSVAVLPFVAMSSGPDDEYFSDGLTEEILNSLARLPELLVTARTSSFAFKGLDTSITEIANKLGVEHVIEGSVRRSGEQLRITAQLIRARDGFHLWSETYDRSGVDSFGVQGEIAEKVAAALGIVLDQEQLAKMRSSGLSDPEAFIAYQKGMEAMALGHERTGLAQFEALAVANQFFERVFELAPDFSAAHFDHGDYFVHFAINAAGLERSADEVARAIEMAKRDFANAARTAETEGDRLNATLEQTLISDSWWRMPELLTAAAHSSDCFIPAWWGSLPTMLDPSPDALTMWQRTRTCDPLNFYAWTMLANTQLALGDFQAALDTSLRGMEAVPHRQIATELFRAYLALGRTEEAWAASSRYVEDKDLLVLRRMTLAAAKGDAAEAHGLRNQLVQQSATGLFGIAEHAMLGEQSQANQLAAEWDARPLGYLELLDQIGICMCGAPFDLEMTPNFARLIGEAKLPWPPPAPIDWPLKHW
jgi:TolB-like protein